MKCLMIILCGLLCSCNRYTPSTTPSATDRVVLITVECRNSSDVQTSVIQALKTVRINDLEQQVQGTSLIIKARYQELAVGKAELIQERLRLIPGVLDILIRNDGVPVRSVN
jgi:hypothetical protein